MALADFSFLSDPARNPTSMQNMALLQQQLANMQKMRQSQELFPLQQRLKEVEAKKAESLLPYAVPTNLAELASKLSYAQLMASPSVLQKNLTPLGKSQVEAGVIPLVQKQMQTQAALNPMQNLVQQALQNLPGMEAQQPQTTGQFIGASPQGQAPGAQIVAGSPQASEGPMVSGPTTPASTTQDLYGLERLKMVTDPATRQKIAYATNIDKTMDMLDPKALTQYSGAEGKALLMSDKVASALGNQPERYSKYLDAQQKANLLAHQIRQFYGDSITAEMQNRIQKMIDPSSWDKSPASSLKLYNSMRDILNNETQTYRDMIKSPTAYQKGVGQKSAAPDQGVQWRFNPKTNKLEKIGS